MNEAVLNWLLVFHLVPIKAQLHEQLTSLGEKLPFTSSESSEGGSNPTESQMVGADNAVSFLNLKTKYAQSLPVSVEEQEVQRRIEPFHLRLVLHVDVIEFMEVDMTLANYVVSYFVQALQ